MIGADVIISGDCIFGGKWELGDIYGEMGKL